MFRRPKIITKGLVDNLPDAISINIEHLQIGMFINIKDIEVEGAEFLAPPGAVIVGVKTARAAIEEEVDEEDEEDEDGETEDGETPAAESPAAETPATEE